MDAILTDSNVFLWPVPPSVYFIRYGWTGSSSLMILHNITPWRKGDYDWNVLSSTV